MKYIIKSKRVNVKPYQRKGKYVIGYQRLDPRNKQLLSLTLGQRNVLRQANDGKIIHTTHLIHDEDREIFRDLSRKGYLEMTGVEGRSTAAKWRITDKGKQLVKLVGKELELGQPFLTQQTLEEMKYDPEETEKYGVAERIASDEKIKSREPEFVGLHPDTIKALRTLIPREELEGIRSIEEFSFHDFTKCKTLPKEPFRDDIEKGYQEHPDYGGIYYHDIARLVIDSTNPAFQSDNSYKKYAMLHEIGHHQWWYHITPEDAQRYEDIWEREKVSRYSKTNSGEGFAEAYAHYRGGMLDAPSYPETYKFFSEVFDQRRLQKKDGRTIPIGEAFSTRKENPNLAKELELAFNDFARSRGFTKKVIGDFAFTNKKGRMFKLIRTRRDGTITVWEEGVGRYDLQYTEEVAKKYAKRIPVMGEPISTKNKEWEVSAKLKNGSSYKGVKIVAPTKEQAIEEYKKTFPKKYVDKYFKKISVIEFDSDIFEE